VFRSDSHFLIGYAHHTAGKPCQDYALSGDGGGRAYAIVCDGCSTGRRTDVGARVVALATETALRGPGPLDVETIRAHQQNTVSAAMECLSLTQQDLLATAVYACLTAEGGFVHLQGDGVLACVWRDGRVDMARYEWKHNTPLYLAYALDGYAAFIAAHGGDLAAESLSAESWQYSPALGLQAQAAETFRLDEGMRGITRLFSAEALAGLAYLAVFTDGVSQIDGVDWKDAVLQLLAFKTSAGEFAKRRMNRLVKDALKTGKGPVDDIAYAVIQVAEA